MNKDKIIILTRHPELYYLIAAGVMLIIALLFNILN